MTVALLSTASSKQALQSHALVCFEKRYGRDQEEEAELVAVAAARVLVCFET